MAPSFEAWETHRYLRDRLGIVRARGGGLLDHPLCPTYFLLLSFSMLLSSILWHSFDPDTLNELRADVFQQAPAHLSLGRFEKSKTNPDWMTAIIWHLYMKPTNASCWTKSFYIHLLLLKFLTSISWQFKFTSPHISVPWEEGFSSCPLRSMLIN